MEGLSSLGFVRWHPFSWKQQPENASLQVEDY